MLIEMSERNIAVNFRLSNPKVMKLEGPWVNVYYRRPNHKVNAEVVNQTVTCIPFQNVI